MLKTIVVNMSCILLITGCSTSYKEKNCETLSEKISLCRLYDKNGRLQRIEYSDQGNQRAKIIEFNPNGTVNKENWKWKEKDELGVTYTSENGLSNLKIHEDDKSRGNYNLDFNGVSQALSKFSLSKNGVENYFMYFDNEGNISKKHSVFYEISTNSDTIQAGGSVEMTIYYPNPLWGKTILLIEDTFDVNFKPIVSGKRKAIEYHNLPIKKTFGFDKSGENTIRLILVDLDEQEGTNKATGREFYIEKKVFVK